MEIKQLKFLDAIVRHRNITRAANELYISQPSMSMSVKKFEEELGFKLFERNKNGLQLTEQGQEFYNKSHHIIQGLNQLEKDRKIIKDKGVETLKVGVIESFRKYVPKLVSSFLQQNPAKNISVIERNSNEVLEELLNYNIHFGITTNTISHKEVESLKLFNQSVSIIFHKNHAFNTLDNIDIKNFEGETLIQSMPGYQLYELITDKIVRNEITLTNELSVETLETAIELVSYNLGVALIPSSYTQNLNDESIRVVHLNEGNNININLIYKRDRYLSPPIYEFIKKIKLTGVRS